MTDKELIKQEIERLKHNTPNAYDLSRFMLLEEIESFIDSLPEEPKKQPKFRVGDTIKGPCNNVFQVKEVLDTQYLLHSENGDELNSIEIVDKYSCISEEPANEDLEEFARYYLLNNHISPLNDILHQADLKVEMQYHKDIENAFKAGAEWQKQQMMKDAVDCVFGSRATSAFVNDFPNIEIGDKVKIIIIKEDKICSNTMTHVVFGMEDAQMFVMEQ